MSSELSRATRCAEIVKLLKTRGLTLVSAESCTAGLVAASIGGVPGASEVFWGGFVSYQVAAKAQMYGIPESDINRWDPVSPETVAAMGRGALLNSAADIAVSTVCYAQPDPELGTDLSGWVAVVERAGTVTSTKVQLAGGRNENRDVMTDAALKILEDRLGLTAT